MSESIEKPKRIDPGVMSVALLDEIAERLLSMENKLEAMTPEGIVEPLKIITSTTTPNVVKPPGKPWFSISIVNDGPADCWIVVNTEKSSTTPYLLKEGETTEIELGVSRIVDVYHYTESETASLRIRGVL